MKRRKSLQRVIGMLLAVFMIVNLPGVTMFAFAEDEGGAGTAVTEPAADLGLSGKALQITTAGDIRVKLTNLPGFADMADGTYEITFSVPWNENEKVPGNVGFLVRYADEAQYAGLSIDDASGVSNWTSHYSKGLNDRGNNIIQGGVNLEPGVAYRVKITYEGTSVSFAYMKDGDAAYTELGSDTLTEEGYTGEGGLAFRINAGNTGVNTIVVDNIVQSDKDGGNAKTVNFDDMADASGISYEARANKVADADNSKATLTLVNVADLPQPPGAEEVLQAAKTAVESASYTAKSESASDAAGAKAAVEGLVKGLGLDSGITAEVTEVAFQAAVDGTKEQPAGTAGSYKFTVTLSMGDADPVTTTELTMTITPAAYVEPEPEELADPGLPPVEMAEGDDDYNQDLTQSTSITGGQAVNINEAFWGMDGYAIQMASGDDYRIKFTDFENLADGAYEIAFRTTDSVPSTLGFLARYVDESKYAGLSIDKSGATWAGHYATSLSGRQNPGLEYALPLSANTTYLVRVEYSGANVTVKAMWEGQDSWFIMGSYTISGGYTGAGGFAIRMRGGTGLPVIFDNIKQYNAGGDLVKELNFNDKATPNTETRANRGTDILATTNITFVEIPASETVAGFAPGRGTKIAAEAAGVYVDSTAPSAANPTYTVQLNGSSNKLGLVFNYQDADNYAAVWYDGAKWVAGGRSGGQDVAAIDLSAQNIPAPDGTRTYRIAYDEAKGYTLTVSAGAVEDATAEDARSYELGRLDGIFTGKGKVGLYVGEAMTLYAGPIQVVYELLPTVLPDPGEDSYITLKSDEMQVLVGSEFPYVYTYKDLAGTVLAYGTLVGSEDSRIYVDTAENLYDATENTNNFVLCNTTSRLVTSSDTSATYEIVATDEANNINATFTVVLTVSGKTLKMEIPSVVEADGSATVRAFQFGNNPVLTLAGLGVGAAMGVHSGWGPMKDDFITLKGASQNATYSSFTYGMFYDTASGVSASVENNAENGNSKYILTQNVSETPYLSLNSASWAWQYYDEIDPEDEEKPYISVVIGGDENADGAITWQDAGVAYRDIMRLPYGYENTKNEWMFIAMNMSSQASQPFLRVLDQAKALSYLTDGFGMKIMNKGYQVSGHDDSHGDYDFSGLQQGGTDGFNTLIDVGLEYGIKNGVHANATEFALDGFDTVLANMRGVVTGGELQDNWNWFDQAYLVDKNKDVWSGALKERIQEFDDALPNLDFVYLDVYQAGTRYKATQLVKYFNEVGITMGTEALQDLNQMITFVHWNTDMYYATGGTQSEVMKFVSHGVGDLAAPDKGILGSLLPGIADWRNYNMFSDGVDVFYRNNLPTKYLQHFELLSWEPSQKAVFSDNVVSTVEGDITTITKDGKVIAKIDTSTVALQTSCEKFSYNLQKRNGA